MERMDSRVHGARTLVAVLTTLAWTGTVLGTVAAPLPPAGITIAQSAPAIDSFTAGEVDDLSPGTELVFTVEGSPKAKATISIAGVASRLSLREVEPGVYEGRYTIKRNDRITGKTVVRATLAQGRRSTSLQLAQPLAAGGGADSAVRIERFAVDPVERLEPGAELVFRLTGTPDSRASFTIGDVVRDRPMEQTTPGSYEGRYTIRRDDNFPPGVAITALLENRGRTARSRLEQGLINDKEAPTVQNVTPADRTAAESPRPLVSAVFDDGRGSGVDSKSVRVRFDGRDVTKDATITANFFNFQPKRDLPPGEYRVEVDLKDLSGNVGRGTWSFDVGRASAATRPEPFVLTVTSPANNSQVPGGPVTVTGKTAAGASVSADVQATTSVIGLFGVNQNVYKGTVQADAQGNFSFQFSSPVTAAGTRYEVNLSAVKDGKTRQQKLILIQQ
ncbi:gll1499 [Gloeobacter violaceus PCC 7421]|uniref:Gll1499 protein n=2 Tax=Gloeobacter violaceus TaxID=33072 RepID=Q7NKH9_GLOVI|nr:gll1499 [Gloeobacter violaceus PCC 7421]